MIYVVRSMYSLSSVVSRLTLKSNCSVIVFGQSIFLSKDAARSLHQI